MVIVVTVVVMIAMVFVIPVAFMHLPALLVVVIVRMAPVGTGVGWPLPDAGVPDIVAAAIPPITIDPGVAFSRHRRPYLIPHRRGSAEIDADLAECRDY